MPEYRVLRIEEQMYGCEELPAGQPVLCDVVLEGTDGACCTLPYPDNDLTRLGIDEGSRARPGQTREIKYLVIHETDNFSAGADAAAHNSFIHQNADADNGIVSWHYTVDDHQIYHHLPDTETAYHAGDMMTEDGGNMNGIGIEMCVNEGGNYEQTLINTEKLCAQLCLAYNLNPDKALKKHQDFMEKVCPARLINEGRWDEFCAAVKQKYTDLKAADAED